jgi:hypothetical protein
MWFRLKGFQGTSTAYFISLAIAAVIYLAAGQSELVSKAIFAPHDSFYPVTHSIFHGFFGLFNSTENYKKNFVAFYLHTPDRVYFRLLFLLGLSSKIVQLVHTLSCYFLLVTGTFFAFSRIFTSNKLLVLATLAYCFSPLMSIFYSSGIFYSISTVVALFVIPLFIHALLDLSKKHNLWVVSCSIFIFSANLMFLLPAVILLCGSTLYQYRVVTTEWLKAFPRGIFISASISTIPIALFVWLNSKVPEVQGWANGSTASAIEGSLFYPLMQIASWAIYNPWEPRAILNFSDFFFTPIFKLLSISVMFFLMVYLVEFKKYLLIFLLIVAAFFAKGPTFPLGEINSFIVEKIPFGYMIRNPDIKFAALISGLILIGMASLPKFPQRIVASLIGVFLCLNIYGIYLNGAISAQQGGHLATSYIYADDYEDVANLINQKKNTIVLSPFEHCSGERYEGKFYTCNDILIRTLNGQVVQKSSETLKELLARYQAFSTVVYFNKHKTSYHKEIAAFENLKLYSEYTKIYESSNYVLFFRQTQFALCAEEYQYSCVMSGQNYVYSLPWFYFEYLSDKAAYSMIDGVVHAKQILTVTPKVWPTILEWVYMLPLLLNLILLYRSARVRV